MKRGIISTLAILIALGATTMSCEKEQLNPSDEHCQTRDGGDDDEDPVIRGKVKKSNFVPVDSAHVETMVYGTNVQFASTYTNELGEYEQKVDSGIYYLKVTNPNSGIPVYTDTMHVNSDREMDVIAD
ncbi:MAG: hypothetical protein A3D31_10070 [Candidatus Fluviicola riflensis]|nr:MAG: hypothetical protein CHH17_14485 [Candidatus Fluviicola riflensis]OGS77350.1 MAG: hypothetical protein A3D31_10070 [Candidatus Fluviicola riflensis]OGS83930.1 MAG: hypothetical protein A3E30_11470 [Fluviicola sp. RIFCSPHIGHO2_12_FULL_43_24]OGS84417.1 MAG: hypothetical protein A2724_07010 [Fluviicola sp. RIFCSPHIGHO2_01_FULL_43_53]